ncbi:MAG: restriction endonuclease subunit S [Gemmatimonadota bacterium]|nr:restriction endonuclease subunit S [Gemmatimonadota bacterium]
MSVRAPVGDVNIATGDCVIGRGIAAVRAGARTDPWYLYFALSHARPQLESRATGSTFASVNKSTLSDLTIPFPPITEQARIGIVLRTLIDKLGEESLVLASAQCLKRAAMRALFSQGLRGQAQKETEVGPVPENWAVVTLEKVCSLSTGTTPSTKRPDYYAGDVPFIKTADIVDNRIRAATTHISRQALGDYSLRVYTPGTVLMAMYGQGKTRGQVSLLEISAATTQNAAAIEPKDGMNAVFLWQYLLSNYDRLRGMGSLGHISHLNLGYLRDLRVVYPPIDEQDEIIAILDAIDRKIDLHLRKRIVLDQLFKVLLHKLMTGEIRVGDLDLSMLEPRQAAEVAA